MKRKLLREFADWLEKSRKPFRIECADECISFQACRFNGEVNKQDYIIVDVKGRPGAQRNASDNMDLVRIFDMPTEQAAAVYMGFGWGDIAKITRKVAARLIRNLANTGEVDWDKAIKAK